MPSDPGTGVTWLPFGLIFKIAALLLEAAEKGEGLEKQAAVLIGEDEPPAA